MTAFLTLLRREVADNRGGLIWTPLVVAAFLLAVTLATALTGGATIGGMKIGAGGVTIEHSVEDGASERTTVRTGVNGAVTVTTTDGETRTFEATREALAAMPQTERREIADGVALGAAVPAGFFLVIAGVAIVFMLLGSLYEERKDRSILFWKSMPVSDLMTVTSKLTAIVAVGFGMALAVAIVTHAGLLAIAFTFGGAAGLDGPGWAAPWAMIAQLWLAAAAAVALYVLWAAPVYGWFLVASAAAPQAPFLVGFLPILVLGAVEEILNLPSRLSTEIFARLTARTLGVGDDGPGGGDLSDALADGALIGRLLAGLGDWRLWAGIVVAAALIWLASEIRRRRTM